MATIEQTRARPPNELVRVRPRRGIRKALACFVTSVRADFELMRTGRAKYLADEIDPRALPIEASLRPSSGRAASCPAAIVVCRWPTPRT